MTYLEAYRTGFALLEEIGDSRGFEADQLFSACLDRRRYDLPHIGGQQADEQAAARFFLACKQRASGRPLQYLLGSWEFFGLTFSVGEGVLIPRPETETLVEASLALLSGQAFPVVTDLCSGSGCIAVSIARKRPDAKVTAVELSTDALPYLEGNIRRNAVRVNVVLGDVKEYMPDEPVFLAVSNPPYIPSGDLPARQREVRFEPAMALDGGADGLDFYRLLAFRWFPLLQPGGYLALEVGFSQAAQVEDILGQAGFSPSLIFKDAAGIQRVVAAQKSSGGNEPAGTGSPCQDPQDRL